MSFDLQPIREPAQLPQTLTRIESAIALAVSPDEIKQVMAVTDAALAFAKSYYKDQQDLIQKARALRLQAERKLGELLRAMPKSVGGRPIEKTSSKSEPVFAAPTLDDLGIDKKTSMRAQKLAALPPEQFQAIASGVVPVSEVLKPSKRPARPKKGKAAEQVREQLAEAQARGVSMLATYIRLVIRALNEQPKITEEEFNLLEELQSAIDQKLQLTS